MNNAKLASDHAMVGFLMAAAGICVACITFYLTVLDKTAMM